MVSLPTDNDRDFRPALHLLERLHHSLTKLISEYVVILSLQFCLSDLDGLQDFKKPTSLTPSLYMIIRLGRVLLAALYACSLSIIISVRSRIILEGD